MLTIGIWYLYYQQYDAQWRDRFRPAIELATNRMAAYTSTNWPYVFVAEHKIPELVAADGIDVNKSFNAVRYLAQAGLITKAQYEAYGLPMFIFAGTNGAFSVDYQSPIYGSDDMMVEERQIRTLIEHEIGHTFGLPDHMRPFTNPEYEYCVQGNLYLGQVQYCSECAPKLRLSNYRKLPYSQLAGVDQISPPKQPHSPVSVEISTEGAFGVWNGQYINLLELIKSWPALTVIPTVWRLRVRSNDQTFTASIKFFGGTSSVYILQPNTTNEIYLDVPPRAVGQYNTEFVLNVGDAVFTEQVAVNVVKQLVPATPTDITGIAVLLGVGILAAVAIGLGASSRSAGQK